MRSIPTILTASLLGALCLVAAALLPDGLEAQEADPIHRGAVTDVADLRKDLEVMRRLLSRSALGTRSTPLQSYTWYYTLANGGVAGGSEALYVAGSGPLFLLRAGFPVAPAPGEQPETAEAPTAWDEVVAEVEGRPKPGGASGAQWTYDAERVAKLEGDVLGVLARFGANLDRVPAGEHITVIVTGRGSPASVGAGANGEGTVGKVVDGDGKPIEVARLALYAALGAKVQEARETVLTIRVAMADCQAAQQGRITPDQLRSRARIHRY